MYKKTFLLIILFLTIANIILLAMTWNHHNDKCGIDADKMPIIFNVNQESNWSHFFSFLREQYANGAEPDREIIIINNKSCISLSHNYLSKPSKLHYYLHFEENSIKCYLTTFIYPAFNKENDSWYYIASDCIEYNWIQIHEIVELINKENTLFSLSASPDFKFNSYWQYLKYFFQNIAKHKLISLYSDKFNVVIN